MQYDPMRLLRWLDREHLRPDRIIVQALDCGMTSFATRSPVFACAPAAAGKDIVGETLAWAEKRGIECWAALDLLRWWQKIEPQPFNPFDKHPDLLALGFSGWNKGARTGRFASPFNPKVVKVLTDLLHELLRRYRHFDGLVLCCRLPEENTEGLDEAGRAAYIRFRQVDPVDLYLFYGPHPDRRTAEFRHYYEWRLDCVGRLVGRLAAEFKKSVPEGRVAVVARGDQYDLPLRIQARTCNDWLTWVVKGYADEVLIDVAWKDERARAAWDSAVALVAKCSPHVPLTCVLTSRPHYWPFGPTEAWPLFLQRGRGIQRVAVEPYFQRCQDEVKPVLQRTLTWRRLPRNDH